MELIQKLISSNMYEIKCPYYMDAEGIAVHNTANDASAENEIKYMQSNHNYVSFHIAVDDVCAIQGLPLNRNAYHAGDGVNGKGNRKHIAIEICYSLSGGDRFNKAEKNCVILIAQMLKERNWGIDKVKKHQDFSGKYCPHRTLDLGWQRFLNMIQAELNGNNSETIQKPSIPEETVKPQRPQGSKQYLYLKPHMSKWNVYPINVAPVTGNQCGTLAPAKFGGLEYEILGNPQNDVYTIQTQSFGKVNIYVPEDNDSEFYSKGELSKPPVQTPASSKQYLNLKPHVSSWRVYPISKAPVIGNEIGFLAPKQYGGISYEILGNSQASIYTIQTQSFGRVNIYAPRDNDSTITSTPIY